MPAGASPIIVKVLPLLSISVSRTAYPSIAEASRGGWVRRADTGAAVVRPNASRIATVSTRSLRRCAAMKDKASVIDIILLTSYSFNLL